jgi:hypothetical protein
VRHTEERTVERIPRPHRKPRYRRRTTLSPQVKRVQRARQPRTPPLHRPDPRHEHPQAFAGNRGRRYWPKGRRPTYSPTPQLLTDIGPVRLRPDGQRVYALRSSQSAPQCHAVEVFARGSQHLHVLQTGEPGCCIWESHCRAGEDCDAGSDGPGESCDRCGSVHGDSASVFGSG